MRHLSTCVAAACILLGGYTSASAALISCHHYGRAITAHKHLPFGTKVRFYNAHASVVATVHDRGPYYGGREYDLDCGLMRTLHIDGVGHVNTQILGR